MQKVFSFSHLIIILLLYYYLRLLVLFYVVVTQCIARLQIVLIIYFHLKLHYHRIVVAVHEVGIVVYGICFNVVGNDESV